jgi:hypothetical protein
MLYNRKCACCGNALSPELKFHDICKVCGWQDDPIQNDEPDYDGGANYISLNEAKKAFVEGKSIRELKKTVKQHWKKQQAALQEEEPEKETSVSNVTVI